MAYYSKDVYERKQIWAEKRMLGNAENENLTEEQHDCLARLCQFRHKLHISHDHAFNPDSGEFSYFFSELSCYEENGITEEAEKLFGSKPFGRIDYPSGQDVYDDLEDCNWETRDKLYQELYEKYYSKAADMFEKVNDQIEKYLKNIDKKYGTDYCPSGKTRNN